VQLDQHLQLVDLRAEEALKQGVERTRPVKASAAKPARTKFIHREDLRRS
jgi:hypothetical protein